MAKRSRAAGGKRATDGPSAAAPIAVTEVIAARLATPLADAGGAASLVVPPASRSFPPASPVMTSPDADTATLIGRVLRERIGVERHAVWFGDGVEIVVDPVAAAEGPAVSVVVGAGSGFSQEWLKRTFRADVEAAVAAVCGVAATVAWRKSAVPAAVEKPAGPALARGSAAARQPAAARGPAALPGTGRQPSVAQGRGSRRAAPSPSPRQRHEQPQPGDAARRPAAELDSFIVGPSNRMAFAAVELSAARPGEMSPLVIHGPSGVGKSHLLEGICGLFRELHPGMTTLLLSAEQFTTSFLQSLHGSGLPGFRRTCRNADLLAIDDLQFFAGKRATAMELQQTVDTLLRQGRQIVFAADRDLEALDGLGPDLVTRLRGGISARIEPPDYDVRRGIVAAVAARRGLALPDDVVHFIATHMTRHARELLGAVNRLEATSHMLGMPITADMAAEALSDLVRSSARSVRLADIERAVCSAFGIESGSLQSARRARTVNHPRMLAMFLARRHTSSALAEIGSYFGRRSHSTVIAAQKTVVEWVAQRSRIVLADASWDVEEAIRRVEDVLRAG
jgi:chromosomal replication initiator protein